LDKEKNQYIKEKTEAQNQNIMEEIKQYQKKWLQHVQRMTHIQYQNKHYDMDQKTKEHRTTEEEMEGPTSF